MRRSLALAVAAFLGCSALTVGALTVASPASAAGLLTGKLASSSDPSLFLPGATVSLRTVTETGPGAVVDTDTSDADGKFALDAGPTPEDEYYVEVSLPKYRGGFVGGSPGDLNYVQFDADFAATYSPDASLGKVLVVPAFIRGYVVNAATGQRLSGIKVSVRPGDDITKPEGTDVTNKRGVFKIDGLECEDDCALRFVGRPRGYENGYRACPGTVVATWGDACASPLANVGKIRLDHL